MPALPRPPPALCPKPCLPSSALSHAWSPLAGKYVSDFADPYLSGHPRHLVLPHLGASTEEAEDNSAAMAADTIMEFLENGTIRNSVNFPNTILEKKPGHVGGRLCIVNKNEAGVLGQITTFFGNKKVNIEQQLNTSRGEIAYTVLDFGEVHDPAGLQVRALKGVVGGWGDMRRGQLGRGEEGGRG